MNTSVLNPALHRRCVATFKNVQIRSEGIAATYKKSFSLKENKIVTELEDSGEYYAVCCPLCNDTRFRCYINHLYGTKDDNNRERTNLVYCYNAGCPLCDKQPEAYEKMRKMLLGRQLTVLGDVKVRPGRKVDVDKIRSVLPGEVVSLANLPKTHPAILYLTKRNFDIDYLVANFDVHFCVKHEKKSVDQRIVMPIYFNHKLVGWQTRAIFDCDWKKSIVPKYYTAPGTPKRNIFYNFDSAVRYRSCFISEGCTDVWRLGLQGLGTLGTGISSVQVDLLCKNFDSGVLIYDPDTNEDKKKLKSIDAAVTELSARLKYGFCRIQLVGNKDPAALHEDFLHKYVKDQAKKAGVKLFYKRKANATN